MTTTQSTSQAHRRRSPYSPGIDPAKLQRLRFTVALMSQAQLAEKAGLSRAWIAKLECGRGRPSVETLRKLCAALECQPADLLYDGEVAELNKYWDAHSQAVATTAA